MFKRKQYRSFQITCEIVGPHAHGSTQCAKVQATTSLRRSQGRPWRQTHMGVSKNRGTPKSSILIGFSIINHPFWGTIIFGNTHMFFFKYWGLIVNHRFIHFVLNATCIPDSDRLQRGYAWHCGFLATVFNILCWNASSPKMNS